MTEPINPDKPRPEPTDHGQTRRQFLSSSGRKALYMAPVIAALSARHAAAASGDPSCFAVGQTCAADGSCCSNNCDTVTTNECQP